MLKIYNTLTHREEIFKPISNKQVGLYTCGPTVYDYDHLGHAWNYFNSDILRRVLEYNDYKVRHIMNITDVGHLVSDADEGEDKLEKGARREGKNPWEISEFYTKVYLENRKKINLLEPHIVCKATDYVSEMVELNKKLLKKGFAYETEDALYFDISKFPQYGKLSGNTLDKLKAGIRIDINPNKKSPYDFALWMKAVGKHKDHIMLWDSPWGRGFPGWHIECSAMSMKHLGEHFDIHTGGEDNIFPHHECEIAQSESATGKKYANYWFHTRFLMVEGEKMSKSLNNFFKIQDIEEKGFNPLALRYLFLTAHYRSQLNFTWESLKASQIALKKLYSEIAQYNTDNLGVDADYKEKFLKYINNDLDMPQVIALVWSLIKSDLPIGIKKGTLLDFDKVLGLSFSSIKQEITEVPKEITLLAKEREGHRKNKMWGEADEVREKIEEAGYQIEDTDKGPKIKKI